MAEPDLTDSALVQEYLEELFNRNMDPIQRVKLITARFQTVNAPNAEYLLDVLGDTPKKPVNTSMSRLFHGRLDPKSLKDLLDILRRNARKGGQTYRLENKDGGRNEKITRRDLDQDVFGVYIDHQIKNVTSDYD